MFLSTGQNFSINLSRSSSLAPYINVYLSVWLSVCLCVCLPVCLLVCLFVCLLVCLCVSKSQYICFSNIFFSSFPLNFHLILTSQSHSSLLQQHFFLIDFSFCLTLQYPPFHLLTYVNQVACTSQGNIRITTTNWIRQDSYTQ